MQSMYLFMYNTVSFVRAGRYQKDSFSSFLFSKNIRESQRKSPSFKVMNFVFNFQIWKVKSKEQLHAHDLSEWNSLHLTCVTECSWEKYYVG